MGSNESNARRPSFNDSSLGDEHDLASYLGITVATLRAWRFQKRGPPFLKLGHLVRYRWEDVQEWIKSRVVTTTKEATPDN